MRKFNASVLGKKAVVSFYHPTQLNTIVVEVNSSTTAITTTKMGKEWQTVRKLVKTIHHL